MALSTEHGAERTLEANRLVQDGAYYATVAAVGLGERYMPEDFPGVEIDMDALFEDRESFERDDD